MSYVIVRIMGGLGNQMFQHALGTLLARAHGVPLLWDDRIYKKGRGRSFQLSYFGIEGSRSPDGTTPPDARKKPLRFRLWRMRQPELNHALEKSLAYDPSVFDVKPPLYLDGYWQSERYFASEADLIRRTFTCATPAEGANARLLDEISGTNAVSLHIRRGDYVTGRGASAVHGTCPIDYYHDALRHIAERAGPDMRIFVFSDDIPWARGNLEFGFPTTFVDNNPAEAPHEDMRLISACRHHVIANSTFSWWGAWLSTSPDKIVVAPNRWFADQRMNNPDIVPASWNRL